MIRCVAIDDEPMALDIIKNFCQRIGGIHISTFDNPVEGLDHITCNNTDIVFLDIDMGDISGLSLVEKFPENISVVFTTAHSKYAIDGFELDATDFLHKPFSIERFERAVEKAMKQNKAKTEDDKTEDTVHIKEGYASKFIKTSEILYIESMDNYVKIHTKGKDTFMPRLNIKKLESMLPHNIIRIHKSYMVNTDNVVKLSYKDLTLSNGVVLPVGRNYKINVKNFFHYNSSNIAE